MLEAQCVEVSRPEIPMELDLLREHVHRNKAMLEDLKEKLIPVTVSKPSASIAEEKILKPHRDRETAVGQSIYESRMVVDESITIINSILNNLQL